MTLLQFFFIVSGVVILITGMDIANKQKFNVVHFLIFGFVGFFLLAFTFFPNSLNAVGSIFGVARGADALVYISIIFLLYFVLLLLKKVEQNKIDTTKIIRELAILKLGKKDIEGRRVFIIPSYNEGKIIVNTIDDIFKKGYKNILVVNDGSDDNTLELLKDFGDSINILSHYINRGQGAALETGFEYIRRYGKVKYIVTYDADGQHSIEDLENFEKILKKDKNIDILLGSRFIGKRESKVPFFRKIILKLGIIFTFFISQIILTDTHNGYRVIRKKALNKLRLTQDGMSHSSEIIDLISVNKLTYKEVPVTIKYTDYSIKKGQRSGNALKIALKILWSKFFR